MTSSLADGAAPPQTASVEVDCTDCGRRLRGEWCHGCGQKRVHEGDLTLGHAGHHLIHEIFHVDGRFWTTLRLLLIRPGQLSVDFLSGRRQRHLHPVRVFLLMAAFVFFAGNATVLRLEHIEERAPGISRIVEEHARAAQMSKARFQEARNPVLQLTYRIGIVSSVLVVGLLQSALFRQRRLEIGAHLTIAAHNTSALLAFSVPLGWLMILVPFAWAPLLANGLALAVYDFLAFRRAYAAGWWEATWKALLLVLLNTAWAMAAMGYAFRRALAP